MILPIPDAPCMEYVYLHLGHFWGFYVGKYSSTMVRIWVVKNIKDGLRWWFSSSHPVNVPRCASGTCPGRFPGKVCARTLSSLRHLKPGFLKICWKAMGFHRWTVEKSWFPYEINTQISTNSWFSTPKLVYPKVPIFRAINNFCLYFTSQSLC